MRRFLLFTSLTATVFTQSFDLDVATNQNSNNVSQGGSNATYNNPIMTINAGDPWMTRYDDYYLFTYSTNDNITLKRSTSLTTDWDNAESRVVFNPDPSSGLPYATDLWAPEIHNISGKWYIIFSATPDMDAPPPLVDGLCQFDCPAVNHRMFVLESSSDDPWTSNFTMKGMLNTFDQFAIDGTYFSYNGNLYMIYSCWENAYSGWPANLCIVQLSDPWTVSSNLTDRRIISVPDQAWEKMPYGSPSVRLATNEGPEQLTNPHTGQNFVLYSASRVNTPFYCIGQLELTGNDPMSPASWTKNTAGCVFHQNPPAGVYATGHASYTTSPDGSEWYIIYHAQTTPNPPSNIYRTVRTQKFTWNDDGSPSFPLASDGPFNVSSGQTNGMGSMST